MSGRRAHPVLVAAATLLALTACTASGAPAPSPTGSAPTATPAVFTLPLSSEEGSCAGTATLPATSAWSVADGALTSEDAAVTVRAYCDSRSRYEKNAPGLRWTLEAVDALVWPEGPRDAASGLREVRLGQGVRATRFAHSSSGSWWLSENAILGDDYVTIEAEVGGEPSAALREELDRVFDRATVDARDTAAN